MEPLVAVLPMLWRILLALLKTAVFLALYGFVNSLVDSSASELAWLAAIARSLSETARMPYTDSVVMISAVVATSLYQILAAISGVVSARIRQRHS